MVCQSRYASAKSTFMVEVFAGSGSYSSGPNGPVLAIGNFDGVHLGHQSQIKALVQTAKNSGVKSCVYKFEPPPRVVLSPLRHAPRIMPWTDKVRYLSDIGVDQVIVERFSKSFAEHPAEWFTKVVLTERVRPMTLVVGYDFRFGKGRSGNIDFIRKNLPDLPVKQLTPVVLNGDTVSSSMVRSLVENGDVSGATALLGRPHVVHGAVVHGEGRGLGMGFPTANLASEVELLPKCGVYLVRARTERGEWVDGVANVGTRPTFEGTGVRVEVHLLEWSGDLYGSELQVAFLEQVRSEVKFQGLGSLKRQINSDITEARARFLSNKSKFDTQTARLLL